ncbi:YecA family protein [Bradyrhizobium sp. AUGA SZCCT0431]|uniref:YecA family protein n=1 Tax=Bradyrhizobium sp. AUGA SZCCT0431 TaxID=2807674 RepID=UPI00201177F7|nr:SEC-C metal-binding domain-containing protein [Bradyrhizobium sp. AUGA SZCCT0431]
MLGRNMPCHCGSGKKYKMCHLRQDQQQEHAKINARQQNSGGPTQAQIAAILRQQKAQEEIRRAQQGLGKPIISHRLNDHQMVAVGNTIHWSKKWKTFPDFLNDYIKRTLGPEWGNAELLKPFSDRHPIMQWYDLYARYQSETIKEPGTVSSANVTGVVACYLGLAYSLYLIAHNVELQARLVKRLIEPTQFQGAYYETFVANTLIRAGFTLELEDETDGATKHCEFTAVSRKTGKKYWVEAKMRSVSGLLGKTDTDGTKSENPISHLSHHVTEALKKPASDDRLIFVDLNTPFNPADGSKPAWVEKAHFALVGYERRHGEADAYVIVTNLPFHRMLNEPPAIMAFPLGLGMPEFNRPGMMRLSEAYRRKQEHIDIYNICESIEKYLTFPASFDGSPNSDPTAQRIKIGETYQFEGVGSPDGTVGTVTAATVNEVEKIAYIAITPPQGGSIIIHQSMTDEAMADYRVYGDAYFGNPRNRPKGTLTTTYELFEWLMECYADTPRARLLELVKSTPHLEDLQKMTDDDLRAHYCEMMAGAMEQQADKRR